MQRYDVEQRLLARHPDLPAGVVLRAIGRAARRLTHSSTASFPVPAVDWDEVEQAVDEQLLLRQVVRLHAAGFGDGRTSPGFA